MTYTTTVTIESAIHILSYTVIESSDRHASDPQFKRIFSLSCTLTREYYTVESETAKDVCRNEVQAIKLAKFLCENTVFPSQLFYILDDLIGV